MPPRSARKVEVVDSEDEHEQLPFSIGAEDLGSIDEDNAETVSSRNVKTDHGRKVSGGAQRPGPQPLGSRSPRGSPSTPKSQSNTHTGTADATHRSLSAPQASRTRINGIVNDSPPSTLSRMHSSPEGPGGQAGAYLDVPKRPGPRKRQRRSDPVPYDPDGPYLTEIAASDGSINSNSSRLMKESDGVDLHCPDFQPKEENQPTVAKITHDVFEVMNKALTDKKDLDKGRIYMLQLEGLPQYVKIGRTKGTITGREKQIQECFQRQLKHINSDDHCKVFNHSKVETLIHTELKKYRQTLVCPCPKNNRGKKEFGGLENLTTHGEWYKVDEAKAREVVGRWKRWMSTEPYCDGVLKPAEQIRIEHFSEDPGRMNGMTDRLVQTDTEERSVKEVDRHDGGMEDIVARDDEDISTRCAEEEGKDTQANDPNTEEGEEIWRWDEFMSVPRWKLHLLLIHLGSTA